MSTAVVIENVFTDEELRIIKQQTRKNKGNEERRHETLRYTRWYVEPWNGISPIVGRALMGKRTIDIAGYKKDSCWDILRRQQAPWYAVQHTVYYANKGDQYHWHTDGDASRYINFIIYLTTPDEGGELELCDTEEARKLFWPIDKPEEHDKLVPTEVVVPKANTMVLMPADVPHRVKPTKGSIDRETLNGHMYYNFLNEFQEHVGLMHGYGFNMNAHAMPVTPFDSTQVRNRLDQMKH
jgi:hypothetical protein